jgi:hypothetical protein
MVLPVALLACCGAAALLWCPPVCCFPFAHFATGDQTCAWGATAPPTSHLPLSTQVGRVAGLARLVCSAAPQKLCAWLCLCLLVVEFCLPHRSKLCFYTYLPVMMRHLSAPSGSAFCPVSRPAWASCNLLSHGSCTCWRASLLQVDYAGCVVIHSLCCGRGVTPMLSGMLTLQVCMLCCSGHTVCFAVLPALPGCLPCFCACLWLPCIVQVPVSLDDVVLAPPSKPTAPVMVPDHV